MKPVRLLLLIFPALCACGQNSINREKIPGATAEITANVINENFGGVGFHVFDHVHNGPNWHYEQVFAKRWRELNPSFARLNDDPSWDFKKLDAISKYLQVMKETNTEILHPGIPDLLGIIRMNWNMYNMRWIILSISKRN